MRLLAMQMTGANGVLSVPDEHLPGLVALVLVGPLLWLALAGLRALAEHQVPWAIGLQSRLDGLGFAAKIALLGSVIGAVVHAAIVPTHWGDERTTAVLFIIDTVGFVLACRWTLFQRRHWRVFSAAMLGGTACVYAFYILKGWETMDLVGLVTSTIEGAAALVVLSPVSSSAGSGQQRAALVAVPLAILSLLGVNVMAAVPSETAAASGRLATGSSPGPQADSSGDATPSAMPGMSGSSSAPHDPVSASSDFSLPTNSPAGDIVWPDTMSSMMTGMKMVEPDCTAQPNIDQQRTAVSLVNETVQMTQKYTSLAAAKAAGYIPVTPSGQRIVHYINPTIYRSAHALDPESIPALVYVNTAHGAVLSAAMYLVPRGENTPQPGGCLTQWHIHTDLCFSGGRVVGNDASSSCDSGSINEVTQPMMHVWLTPVPGGPLAPDPSGLSEVEAALKMPTLNPQNGTA
jgi:hypothetical protein